MEGKEDISKAEGKKGSFHDPGESQIPSLLYFRELTRNLRDTERWQLVPQHHLEIRELTEDSSEDEAGGQF